VYLDTHPAPIFPFSLDGKPAHVNELTTVAPHPADPATPSRSGSKCVGSGQTGLPFADGHMGGTAPLANASVPAGALLPGWQAVATGTGAEDMAHRATSIPGMARGGRFIPALKWIRPPLWRHNLHIYQVRLQVA
jgi:hypothetical protein